MGLIAVAIVLVLGAVLAVTLLVRSGGDDDEASSDSIPSLLTSLPPTSLSPTTAAPAAPHVGDTAFGTAPCAPASVDAPVRVRVSNAADAKGERLFPHDRPVLEAAFSEPGGVFETYGCREFMLMASECPAHAGLHTSMENLIVEIIDSVTTALPIALPRASPLRLPARVVNVAAS